MAAKLLSKQANIFYLTPTAVCGYQASTHIVGFAGTNYGLSPPTAVAQYTIVRPFGNSRRGFLRH
jgi:hypothetical protein